MPVCAVTGAHGLIGSHCIQALRARGHVVREIVHTRRRESDIAVTLGQDVSPATFAGIDVLVHCAYQFGLDRGELHRINVLGSQQLIETAHAAGVKRIVFMSSISAYDGCRSDYGAGKFTVERTTLARGGIVLRPGLVYGEPGKGMFGMLARLTRLPILPVFDGGRQPMLLVHVDDLAEIVGDSIAWEPQTAESPVVVAHPRAVMFRTILETIAARQGRRIRFLSIPGQAALTGLTLLERCGMRIGFSSDNLMRLLYPADVTTRAGPARGRQLKDFLEVDRVTMGV